MNNLKNLNLGVALCGSFCTFHSSIKLMEELVNSGINVYPIMSNNAYNTSTRFGDSEYFIEKIKNITNKNMLLPPIKNKYGKRLFMITTDINELGSKYLKEENIKLKRECDLKDKYLKKCQSVDKKDKAIFCWYKKIKIPHTKSKKMIRKDRKWKRVHCGKDR